MNSIFITGCNRGLGLGLVKTLIGLPKPPKHVFATCRDLEKAVELNDLAQKNANVHIIQADVRDFNAYERIVKEVQNVVGNDGLNVLFNNAGISPKSTRINFAKADEIEETFRVNTIAPIMLTKAFIPLLKRAAAKNDSLPMGVERAVVINMSSVLASIEKNVEGGLYAYRTSKTGLNAATKSMSLDLKDNGILAIALHPGWVKTDLGGSNAPMTVEVSCKKMIETILKLTPEQNGTFLQYSGKSLPCWLKRSCPERRDFVCCSGALYSEE